MNLPNFNQDQYVDADSLNAAVAAVSGTISVNLAGTFFPGLVSPNSATFTTSGLTLNSTLAAPFGVVFGNGVLANAHGVVAGSDTQSYSTSFAGVVPGSGSITAYLLASYSLVQQTAIAIVGPPPGHPDYNPNFVPFTGYQNNVDTLSLSASTSAADNSTTFELCRFSIAAGATGLSAPNLNFQNRRAPVGTFSESILNTPGVLVAEKLNSLTIGGTYTLPAAASANMQRLTVVSNTSGAITIAASGSDNIFGLVKTSYVGVSGFAILPGASTSLVAVNGTWQLFAGSGGGLGDSLVKIPLAQNTTFFFSPSGSDTTGDGTASAPWRTLQYGANFITGRVNANGFSINMSIASGTYTDTTFSGQVTGLLTPIQMLATGGTVTITGSVGGAIYATNGASVQLASGTFLLNFPGAIPPGGNGTALLAVGGSIQISGAAVTFGACTGGHMLSEYAGNIVINSNYTITNSAPYHMLSQYSGVIQTAAGVTLTGTPNFSTAFAYCLFAASLIASNTTYSGLATGKRYESDYNAIINTGSAGATGYFPGSISGTTTSGIYV